MTRRASVASSCGKLTSLKSCACYQIDPLDALIEGINGAAHKKWLSGPAW